MKGMELMIGSILQSMGVDPLQVKAAIEKTVSELETKIASIDAKLTHISTIADATFRFCEIIDARVYRLEVKLETLPIEDIFESAKHHNLLVEGEQDGRSDNDNGNCHAN